MWGVVVLDRAEVVHLLAAGEVQGDLAGAPAGPGDAGLGAHAGVVPAEGDGGQRGVRVAVADGLLVADLPGRLGQLVDAEVAHPGGLPRADLDDRDDEHESPSVDVKRSTTVTSLSAPASMTSRGNTAVPSPAISWVTTIGSADRRPGGHADDDRGHERRVELGEDVRGVVADDVGQLGQVAVVDDEAGAALDRGRGADRA